MDAPCFLIEVIETVLKKNLDHHVIDLKYLLKIEVCGKVFLTDFNPILKENLSVKL